MSNGEGKSVVLIFSGGLDSTVALFWYLKTGYKVHALSVNYGQRHLVELVRAKLIADILGVEHRIADLRGVTQFMAGSSQTDRNVPVPHGHYAEESMKATVVPNRNMIMLSVAAAWAISLKADAVAYAAHGGDHAIYPDCRDEFAGAMRHAIELADWHKVSLWAPFVEMDKARIAALGHELGVPFELTWSCYEGAGGSGLNGGLHCGRCGTCVERREAFKLSGVPDPTGYADTLD